MDPSGGPNPRSKKNIFFYIRYNLPINFKFGPLSSKALALPLTAQTTQSKRKFKTHPQLQLIVIYKSNSGGKIEMEKVKRERPRDGVINMFAERGKEFSNFNFL